MRKNLLVVAGECELGGGISYVGTSLVVLGWLGSWLDWIDMFGVDWDEELRSFFTLSWSVGMCFLLHFSLFFYDIYAFTGIVLRFVLVQVFPRRLSFLSSLILGAAILRRLEE